MPIASGVRRLLTSCCLALAALATVATTARADLTGPKVGIAPLSDKAAAKLVKKSSFEPRQDNAAANHHMPSKGDLAYFRAHSDNPYKGKVTGHYTGTTDEIIQWAARKWELPVDLFRGVATVESWWHMSTNGDNGDSFGLFQIRRPYHCCDFLAKGSTAFNADYYGANLRSYYDGKQGWLNTVSDNGAPYQAGDLWGAVGEWYSGRWHHNDETYVNTVKQRIAEKTWLTPDFANG